MTYNSLNFNAVQYLFGTIADLYNAVDQYRATATGSDYFAAHNAACVLDAWLNPNRAAFNFKRGDYATVKPVNLQLMRAIANLEQAVEYAQEIADANVNKEIERARRLVARIDVGGGLAWVKW